MSNDNDNVTKTSYKMDIDIPPILVEKYKNGTCLIIWKDKTKIVPIDSKITDVLRDWDKEDE